MEKIKLFIDEDVHAALSSILRKRGFDAIHAQETSGKGFSDADQLDFAVQQERCLLSYNVKDYVLLHNSYIKQEYEHWGIIVSRQLSVGETLRRVLRILQNYSKQTMKNRILFMSRQEGVPGGRK